MTPGESVEARTASSPRVGIDLGGTNIVSGCVAEDGSTLLGARSEPTGADEGPDAVVKRIIRSAQASIAATRAEVPTAEIIGAGIGSPGPLDTRTGIVLLAPNLGWVNMPLRARLQEGLGLRTALDNDANCAVLGEWWMGAARGTRQALGAEHQQGHQADEQQFTEADTEH